MHPVPAAKTAIKALIDARSAWATCDVRDDPPTEGEDLNKDDTGRFWFDATEVPEDAWSAGGRMRQITFRVGFSIDVLLSGDDGRAAEDVMWGLLEDFMSALKGDPTLGGAIQTVGDVTGRQSNGAAPGIWQARFTGAVECLSNFY